jgi:hypothetical protein
MRPSLSPALAGKAVAVPGKGPVRPMCRTSRGHWKGPAVWGHWGQDGPFLGVLETFLFNRRARVPPITAVQADGEGVKGMG